MKNNPLVTPHGNYPLGHDFPGNNQLRELVFQTIPIEKERIE
jgi:hypothetical protein